MKPYHTQLPTHYPCPPLPCHRHPHPHPTPHSSNLGLFYIYKTKLNCGYICIISILQLGSAYSLYSGFRSYKILSDYKKENNDDPTDLPVDEKYVNSMFIFLA